MLKLLTAPATNERGPHYMEKALAAIHQADHERRPVTLIYGVHEGRVGLSVRFQESMQEHVTGPILANYPNCSLTVIERNDSLPVHGSDTSSDKAEAWTAELALVPELFPVLRHSQFEDMLNRNFADPVSGLLRAIKPAEDSECRIEITVTPATSRRCHRAMRAVKRLDREFFRRHHRLARYYAKHITRPRDWFIAWLLGLIALTSPEPTRTTLETSTSRLHEREDDLQAASDKVGCHLFETQIRLSVFVPTGHHHDAADRIRQMAGAFGAFTKSRLAKFHLGPIRREHAIGCDTMGRHRSDAHHRRTSSDFLLSHEELATLWHPPTANNPELLYSRALALHGLDRYDEALEITRRLQSDFKDAEAAQLLSAQIRYDRAYRRLVPDVDGELKALLKECDSLIGKYKGFGKSNAAITCHVLRGTIYTDLGQPDKALSDANEYFNYEFSGVYGYTLRGYAYTAMGDFDNAKKNLDIAIGKLGGRSAQQAYVYNSRSVSHRKFGYYAEAIADANKALELNPNLLGAIMHRGLARLRQGDAAEAEKDFATVLEKKPYLRDFLEFEKAAEK